MPNSKDPSRWNDATWHLQMPTLHHVFSSLSRPPWPCIIPLSQWRPGRSVSPSSLPTRVTQWARSYGWLFLNQDAVWIKLQEPESHNIIKIQRYVSRKSFAKDSFILDSRVKNCQLPWYLPAPRVKWEQEEEKEEPPRPLTLRALRRCRAPS